MADNKDTYKKGLKGIAVFGGLQFYKILLSVLTAKVSAIFLGPAGSGIYGLLTSTLTTAESIISCGIGTSAVKDIAQAKKDDDKDKIAKIYLTVRYLVFTTGVIGSLLIFIFATKLSYVVFGNDEYSVWLRIISVTILINQLITGQGVLLLGYQKYKLITQNGLITGLSVAIITIFCYTIWGIYGIIPVIILSSIAKYILSTLFARRIKLPNCHLGFKEILEYGKPIFILGFSIGISAALASLAGLSIRIIISNFGDLATVGLFTSSFSLVNTYFGLVFSAIQGDYYPRLSEVSMSPVKYNRMIIDEIELLILLMTPLVAILIVFAKPVLFIFYSSKYLGANILIGWSAFSMLVRVPSWAMTTGLISKGESSSYLKNQLTFIIYQLGFNILGFIIGGLTGIGITYTISELIYFIQNYWFQYRKFGVKLDNKVCKIIILSFSIILALCLITTILPETYHYTLGSIICLAILIYSLKELNSRISIIGFVKNKLKRNK